MTSSRRYRSPVPLRQRRDAFPLFVFLLFFLSGAVGLVYEVLWLRQLALVFGGTAFAASVTLAAFMAGLGIGGRIGGQVAGGHAAPLRLYGCLEIALVCAAAAVGPLLWLADWIFSYAYRSGWSPGSLNALRAVVSFAVLFGPTFLMGATLPALAEVIVHSPSRLASRLGMLYAVNTLGAAGGSFAAGFVLLAHLGVSRTRWVALAVNALVGIAALTLSRGRARVAPARAAATPEFSPSREAAASPQPGGRRSRLLLLAYGVSGAVALASEVIWTRSLVFYTGSTTYAFSVMLTVLLIGLATGSLVMSRIGDSRARAHLMLAFVFVLTAFTLVVGHTSMPQVARSLDAWVMSAPSWSRVLAIMVGLAMTTLFLPAVGFGAVFPLVTRDEVLKQGRAGPGTGRAYSVNLLGSVVGALAGGFVLIPALGLYGSLRLLAFVLIAMAIVLGASAPARLEPRPAGDGDAAREKLRSAGGAIAALMVRLAPGAAGSARWAQSAVVLLALLAALPAWIMREAPLHRPGPGERLEFYREGANATVSVLRDPTGAKTISIDRVAVAGTDPVMQTDQKSLAHIPMLLHPDPRRILTVGFGSGGASWSYTLYPMLREIDCVEIAPEVTSAAPYLKEANHTLFDDPRYRVIFEDARSYLDHTEASYDIIATDCTDLRYRGNASLYTSDYFRLCRRRLRPRGLVIVWMPLGGLASDVFKVALNTFASEFRHVSAWYMNNYPTHYLLLVGSEAEQDIQWERLLERLEIPAVRADLASIELDDPLKLLSMFLLDDRAMRSFAEGAPLNSDDRPLLEFRAPRSTDRYSGARNLQDLLALVERRPPQVPLVTRYGSSQWRTVLAKLEPYLRAALLLDKGHVSYQSGARDYEAALAFYREAALANPQDGRIPFLIDATERTRSQVAAAYEAAAKDEPDAPGVLHDLGLTLLDAGQNGRAVEVFRRLVSLRPDLVDARLDLSRAARAAGDGKMALSEAREAVRLAPSRADAHFQHGLVLQDARSAAEALQAFQRALALQPDLVEADFNAGIVLATLGRFAEARDLYRAGLQRRPGEMAARMNLAQILLQLGEKGAAIEELRRVAADQGPVADQARQALNEIVRAR